MSSNNTPTEDAAALLRVRNRVADTPDAKLPSVLHKLLPRLVSRFPTTTPAAVDPNLAGIFEHIRERVLLNPKGLLRSEWVSSLLESIEVAPNKNGGWAHYKYVLPILEIALAQCDVVEGALPRLICILEDIHVQASEMEPPPSSGGTRGTSVENGEENNSDVTMEEAANDDHEKSLTTTPQDLKEAWERIGWCVVEQIAKKSNLPPILDWNYVGDFWDDVTASGNHKKIQECTPTEEERKVQNDALYSLFLDFITFDPSNRQGSDSRWQFRRQTQTIRDDFEQVSRQQQAERELIQRSTTRNLVIGQHRRRRDDPTLWNEAELRYWRALQRCIRAYAVQLVSISEREDVLRILTGQEKPASSPRPYKRPKASDVVKQNQRKLAALRLQEQQKQTRKHNLTVGSALLHLVLGEDHARGAIRASHTTQPAHYALLGNNPKGQPPLPQPVAQRVFAYLLTAELNLDTTGDNDDLDVFLDLLKELKNVPSLRMPISMEIYEFIGAQTPPPMCWAIQFLWKVSTTTNQTSSTLSKRAWEAATELLDCLQDISVHRFERQRRLAMTRSSQDRRIHEHREKQALQNQFVAEALQARSEAYQLVTKFITEERIFSTTGQLSWDVAVRMLNCAAFDLSKDTLPALQEASICTLSIYRQAMTKIKPKACPPINSMLLPLLKACISSSDWSREFALQFSDDILVHVDPGLSSVIVEFLSSDEVQLIAGRAQDALKRLSHQGAMNSGMKSEDSPHSSVVSFFDLQQPADREAVAKDLQDRIASLMETHNSLTPATASIVLQEFNFSQSANAATVDDLETLLCRYGFAQTQRDAVAMDVDKDTTNTSHNDTMCEVCYEDIPSGDGFALRCGHRFCMPCWQEGLQASASASAKDLVKFSCLRHDCNTRATREDVIKIDPGMIPKLEQSVLEYFVIAGDYTFCPGADCTAVALSSGSSAVKDLGQDVICNLCHSSFCVQCGGDPHSPATCAVRLKYKAAADRVEAHEDSVENKTIECPNCGTGITKNGGCNHMTCTQCGHEFCWICLSADWQDHVCNVFDSLTDVDDLQRVQFFRHRIDAHRLSRQAAQRLLDSFQDHAQDLLDHSRFSGNNHLTILKQAWETLVAGRNYLANSYIVAYGMSDIDESTKQEFEMHQSQLQLFIEQLSLLSDNVPNMYNICAERDFQRRFRGIRFCTMAVEGYRQRVDSFMKRSFYS